MSLSLSPKKKLSQRWIYLLVVALVLSACQPQTSGFVFLSTREANSTEQAPGSDSSSTNPEGGAKPTPPYPSRPRYLPGELVDYTAQEGDTLPYLASRFNTSVEAILEANTFIPATATTMPPGMPMKIPIYYLPLWGSPYRILPDSLFVNGPAQVDFDTQDFVNTHPGWLKHYKSYVADVNRSGAEIVDYVAHYWSVSPRLLLALLEYHSGALSQPVLPQDKEDYPLGSRYWNRKGLFLQLVWAANLLNNNYYEYKDMGFNQIVHSDDRITRFDPWLNAATVSLHVYFNILFDYDEFLHATSAEGFARTYANLFGDP